MSVYHEDLLDIDLNTGSLKRSFSAKALGKGDSLGNRFGVRVFRGGMPVVLAGVSVTGYFIRSDGTTIVISGNRDGNACWVTLPQQCYAVDGAFRLSINLTDSGGSHTTARIVDGTVIETALLGQIIDPGGVIQDLSSFTALVERAEQAAAKIESFELGEELITGTRYRIGVINAS